MTASTVCPYCHEPHTLSQCPKWIIAGRPTINDSGAGQAVEGALRGEGAPAAAARAGADLRVTMPQTAEMIDGLREAFGRTVVDAILRATSKGRPQAYFAELGADGQLREWGRAPSGRRAVVVGGRVAMPSLILAAKGIPTHLGPSSGLPGRGNSDPDHGLFHGPAKGVI